MFSDFHGKLKEMTSILKGISRRDLRPYDQQKLEKDTTSQVFLPLSVNLVSKPGVGIRAARLGSPIFTPDPNADPWLKPKYFKTLFRRKLLKTFKI